MKWPRFLTAIAAACCAIGLTHAEKWQTTVGRQYEGGLAGVYGTVVVLAQKNASVILSVEDLDDDGLTRVASFLARPKPASTAWKDSAAAVSKVLLNRMEVLRDGKFVNFDPGDRTEPEFYLVYFGAYWCGPCRRFSPGFVEKYRKLKQLAPDRFEVVFVSSDTDEGEMHKYAREVNMPWPILRFKYLDRTKPVERWAGSGIPCVVAITRAGDLLFHSYHGTEYVGPGDVLDKFEKLLQLTAGSGRRDPRLHRLAIVQQIQASAGGNRAAEPYLLGLDLKRYQRLGITNFTVTVDIDENGRVTDARITPELPYVIENQLVNDAGKWLFLPAVADGKPHATRVALPVKLDAPATHS